MIEKAAAALKWPSEPSDLILILAMRAQWELRNAAEAASTEIGVSSTKERAAPWQPPEPGATRGCGA